MFICNTSILNAQTYKMGIGPAPGYIHEEGRYSGNLLLHEVLKGLQKKNIHIETGYYPWPRADLMFNEGQINIEFPALLGDKALQNAIFSAPVSVLGLVIYIRKDAPPIDLEDLDNFTGVLGIPLGHEKSFEFLSRYKNLVVETVPRIAPNLRKLSTGRIDAFLYWNAAADEEIKKEVITNLHHGKLFKLSFGCFALHNNEAGRRLVIDN